MSIPQFLQRGSIRLAFRQTFLLLYLALVSSSFFPAFFFLSISATTDTDTGESLKGVAQGFVKLSPNEVRVAGRAVEACSD